MNIRLCLLTLLLSFALLSCREHTITGSGPSGNEARSIQKSFNSIEIDAPVDANITVRAGIGNAVSLAGYANILQFIHTEVRDSTLRIFIPDGIDLDLRRSITATITCPALVDVSINGTGNVQVSGNLATPEFSADIEGTGSVGIQSLQAERLNVEMSGTGSLSVAAGKVARAKYELSGTGTIKAYGLESARTTCEISGAGRAEVFATEKLDATVNGVGSITYRGDPKVAGGVNGVGSIKRADGAPVQITEHKANDDEDSTDEN